MVTFLPKQSAENDGSDDDESNANPLLEINPRGGGGDDDDPPAAGAVMVTREPSGPKLSLAPTAEPTHEAKPELVTV
ncbi:hypothetical protein HJTV-2_gp129 [Haloarcula virus HJTV-2]|uniref:Uncharacterized protein n=2 Tax=Haloferacalesvirus TaxID=2843389 RepID=A0AAE8XX81_9CAUD|nr:hypothetical protein M1M33_gp018 [Haloarcula virus HJTV-2]YP_010358557.1 hypothetical protein M1M41_gp012 [Halorubrum sodomense tailed virus 4]UBF21609.1 hypothetical protein HRTV-24_gp123 [Halorubrum virus HRTV-24]UBF21878.1 hypothetical protein HSTV-3_gp118 [Halorubrum virus HSTV-3]UBF22008.1 hypothetical protein HJTV-3_gp119 [Haloarcula virus HJTV-3]UBF22137.1 hypothetical protein HRTV-15_gp118 [Halorubrum virus HRTV-15]UBF20319.1 hypothetical protein HSTV-4_gp112 [Halorubrum sodomense 